MALEFSHVLMGIPSTMPSSSWDTLHLIGLSKTNGEQISESAAISMLIEILTETAGSGHLPMS